MKFTTFLASLALMAALANAQRAETTADALRHIYYR